MCLMTEETEKVFSYMDMLTFSQSLKACVALAEKLKMPLVAAKVTKYLQDKENRDLFNQTTIKTSSNLQDKRVMPPQSQVGFGNKFKSDAPDMAKFQPVTQPEPAVVATNPFSKQVEAPATQLADDVFADLKEGPSITNPTKRTNPFAKA